MSDDAETPLPETEPVDAPRGAHPVLVYSALRLLLVAVTAGVLWLVGLRQPLLLLVFAFLISGVISVFVLDRRREVAAVEVVTAVQRVNQRIDESKTAEDHLDPDGAGSGASQPAARSRALPADDDLDDLEPTDDPPIR